MVMLSCGFAALDSGMVRQYPGRWLELDSKLWMEFIDLICIFEDSEDGGYSVYMFACIQDVFICIILQYCVRL